MWKYENYSIKEMKWRIITILFYFTFPFIKYKHCNIVTILSVRGRLILSTCTALTAGRLVRPIVLLSSFICCDFVPSASYPVTPCLLLGSIKSALIKHYTFYLYWSECRHLYRATGWAIFGPRMGLPQHRLSSLSQQDHVNFLCTEASTFTS